MPFLIASYFLIEFLVSNYTYFLKVTCPLLSVTHEDVSAHINENMESQAYIFEGSGWTHTKSS